MLFNEERYYEIIKTKETMAILKFIITIAITILILVLANHFTFKISTILTMLIGILLGMIIGDRNYEKARVEAEEMKMKLEIYQKIISYKENS